MIKIFGHMAPDTDATCSAIIWEWYMGEVKGKPAKAYVLEPPNKEAVFVLGKWGREVPPVLDGLSPGDEVIIVDTNNPAELPENVNESAIVQIIDHHLLAGGLKTSQPVEIAMKPLASTATVMRTLMGDDAERMPESIRGLMLSCILSDTLEFRSPTTTGTDREIAAQLAEGLKISVTEYAAEMFAAKSDVSDVSDEGLIRMDSKKYEVGGKSFRVSVLETTDPQTVMQRKSGLMEAMDRVAGEDGVDQVLMFIVDILREEATLLAPNDLVRDMASKSFGARADGDTVTLPGVVSRKKQIIPNLKL